jgi:hypothetical protein
MNTPLGDPVVTIDGQSYTLKFSLLAQYIADKRGIDVIPEIRKPGPGKLALTLDLFSAMVSDHFERLGKPIPTSEYWAGKIPETAMPEISKAVMSVLGKWLGLPDGPQTVPATEQAPAVQ